MTNSSKIHALRLEELLAEPELIGIDNVLWGATEFDFRRPNGDTVAEVDLILFNGDYHIIEYKRSCTRRTRARAAEQLYRGWEQVNQYFGADPVMLFVYGRYIAEQIMRE